jgi:hypothetical protein
MCRYGARHSFALSSGDRAYFGSGTDRATCEVVKTLGLDTFSCFVGTDYRTKYAVTINGREVTISQYFGPTAAKRYAIVIRRIQTPTRIAHP